MPKKSPDGAPRTYNPAGLSVPDVMALKKKASPETKIQVRVGGKKLDIPVTAQVLKSNENGRYMFVSIPSMNVVFGVNGDGAYEIVHETEKGEAVKSLKKAVDRRRTVTQRSADETPELPAEVLNAISKAVPAGYRIGVDQKTGDIKLVKMREKRKKS